MLCDVLCNVLQVTQVGWPSSVPYCRNVTNADYLVQDYDVQDYDVQDYGKATQPPSHRLWESA